MAGGSEVVLALCGRAQIADAAQGFEIALEASGLQAAQVGRGLGEGHLDRVEVGAVATVFQVGCLL